jgi:hypothetical protein
MFIHLVEDYSLKEIWLFEWQELYQAGRFIEHKVRGSRRSFVVRINTNTDKKYLVYTSVSI